MHFSSFSVHTNMVSFFFLLLFSLNPSTSLCRSVADHLAIYIVGNATSQLEGFLFRLSSSSILYFIESIIQIWSERCNQGLKVDTATT